MSLALVLLLAIQAAHFNDIHSVDNIKKYSSPELRAIVKAQLDPLDLQSLKSHPLNQSYDLLLIDKDDNAIYWTSNNRRLSKSDNITITEGPYSIILAEKEEYHSQINDDNDAIDSITKWLTTSLLFFLFFTLLYIILKKWKANKGNKLIFSVIAMTCLSILILIIGNNSHLPEMIQKEFIIFNTLPTNIYNCIVFFICFAFLTSLAKNHLQKNNSIKNLYSAISSFAISALFFLEAEIISNAINEDVITAALDTPLQYNFRGIIFIISLLIISVSIFYFSVISHGLFSKSEKGTTSYVPMMIGITCCIVLGLVVPTNLPIIPISLFVMSYLLILDLYIDQTQKTVVFVLLWLIIFSGFIASISFYTQLEKDITARKSFVTKLYTEENKDVTKTVKSIDETIRRSMVSSQLATLPYPAKLDRADITSYITKQFTEFPVEIDLSVESYDSDGTTLFKNHFSQEEILNESIFQSRRLSKYIYYNPLEANYILNYYIENENYINSPLRLIITVNKYNANDIYLKDYNYYIIKNKMLLNKSQAKLPMSVNKLSDIRNNKIIDDYSFVIHNPADNIIIGSHQKVGGLLKPISLFSFIITLSGLLLLLLGFLNSRFQFLPNELDFTLHFDSSLKNKIQYTIIALIIFSFILIGLMTIIYFKNVLESRNKIDKEIQITSIINDINSSLSTKDQEGQLSVLQNQLTRLSHVHQREINLYDKQGQLSGASYKNPEEYRIPYKIYSTNNSTNSNVHFHNQTYKGNRIHYIPLFSSSKTRYATLGVLESSKEINNYSLLDFLSTILNVYIFLFLVAGAIAIAISNSVTKPLSYLSSRLREFKLGKNQEKLTWSSNDEIGSLIDSYNELTSKLDESANIIAKTERDTAWREMAKQVAHEIKNPLTPMKLSIQHLQRMSGADPEDLKPRLDRISKTLLEQFNNLDNIANSFSNFATMPTASNEKIILNEVVEAVHDLFRKREDILITLSEPITDLYIYADRNHVVRVLNNIVKNAIQAIPNTKAGEIHISLEQSNNNALIKVVDNGTGIPDHMKEKVFTPNFTTKNSGTGLGLAISANMIEAFNGKLYFETEEGTGTTFFIEIPLMRLDKNFENDNRVVLD